MDWSTQLLFLAALAGVLLVGAGLLYIICYCIRLRTTGDDVDDDIEGDIVRSNYSKHKRQPGKSGGGSNHSKKPKGGATIGHEHPEMCSALQASGEDNDVILATAISSIPLKQLGGKRNEIVIDVAQQLYVNEDWLDQCVVCKTRNKVTCFAQTTIKVLVFRPLASLEAKTPTTPPIPG